MERILLACFVSVILLSSCQQTGNVRETQTSTSQNMNWNDTAEVESGTEVCTAHTLTYHAVSGELVDYIGQEAVHDWYQAISSVDKFERANEDFSVQSFIKQFQITQEDFKTISRENITNDFLNTLELTREEYYKEFGYTDAQIEALYSGNQATIDEAFCGPLAFVNEADGKLYSIYWLAEHTPEDYIAADLPMEEVKAIIEKAASEEFGLTELAEAAQSKLTRALSLASEAAPAK